MNPKKFIGTKYHTQGGGGKISADVIWGKMCYWEEQKRENVRKKNNGKKMEERGKEKEKMGSYGVK